MEPKIKISLYISANRLNLQEITAVLNLCPSETRKKEDFPKVSQEMGFACDEWVYTIPKIECKSVSSRLNELETVFSMRIEQLNEIKYNYNADVGIVIVIEMEAGNHPELCFSKSNIEFIHSIQAEVGIDPYIDYPEND